MRVLQGTGELIAVMHVLFCLCYPELLGSSSHQGYSRVASDDASTVS